MDRIAFEIIEHHKEEAEKEVDDHFRKISKAKFLTSHKENGTTYANRCL